jgi:hexosaminidase
MYIFTCKVVDSMVYAKLNVLHWHVVDAQSFPLQIKSFPKLWQGAWSPQERYTQQQVRFIVEYARCFCISLSLFILHLPSPALIIYRLRAVRVMVEFDGPGHMMSWGLGYPEVLPEDWDKVPSGIRGCLFAPV